MPKKKRRIVNIIALTSISFIIVLGLYLSDILASYENRSFDIFSRTLNPAKLSDRIVIVEIDQQSIDGLSSESINWPWPRQLYAPIIDFLSLADAVFIDILFTEPSSYGVEDDEILGEAITKAGNVYLPFFLSKNEKPVLNDDIAYLKRFAIQGKAGNGPNRSFLSPTAPIRRGVRGAGNVAISPDNDGVYRRVPLTFSFLDMTLPSLPFSFFTAKRMARADKGELFLDNAPLPLRNERILLRFPRDKNAFTAYPAIDILNACRTAGDGKNLTKEFFKGKVIFLGTTAPGLLDLKSTPTMAVSTGVHINATAFENLDRGTYMRPVPKYAVVIAMLAICFFFVIFVLTFHSITKNLTALIAGLIFITGMAAILFVNRYYLPTTYLVTSVIISFVGSIAFSYASEGRERQFIKRTFSQYMDKTIVEYVLQNPDIVKPGGKKARVTVLFADIAGFTTISERNSPEDTALMLHRVLNELTEVVIEQKGVVDKYIGDCIMAFWGAPLATDEDEINSCHSAIRFIDAINAINPIFEKEGIPPVSIRVGLHTGDAIAGNMGSARLFDFTVVGDTVNLASRLESVNKVFGTNVIVSDHTLMGTRGIFLSRELGPIEVKGKSQPVIIHELLCEKDNASPSMIKKIELYNKAYRIYQEGRFDEAIIYFDRVIGEFPDDGPSHFYRKRMEGMKDNFPLTKDVHTIRMTEK